MQNQSPERQGSHAVALFLILALAAALRLILLGHKIFSADEGIAWWMALGKIEHDAPLIYHWAFNWAIPLFGWKEFAGRLPSAWFGFLSIPVIYAVGRTCFDRRFGLWAAFIAAISAYLVPLSQEMRIYSLLGLEILLTLWIFLHLLRDPRAHSGWWIALLLVGIAGQYTHCFFIFVLGYFGLALVLSGGAQWQRNGIRYLIVLIAVLLLSLPELLRTFSVAGERPYVYAADFFHLKMNAYRVLRSYYCFLFGDYLTNHPGSIVPFLRTHPFHLGVALVMMSAWITIAFLSIKEIRKFARGNDYRATVVRILTGMLVAFTLLFLVVDVSTSGHLIFIYVPFFFLAAIYWTCAHGKAKSIVVTLFLFLTAISLISYYRSPFFAYERADWRAAGKILEGALKDDDALLILRARNAYYTLKFYFPGLNSDVHYYPRHDPEAMKNQALMDWWNKKSPQEQVDSLLESHKRVWVAESNLRWRPSKEAAKYIYRTWDLGYNLQLHLIEPKYPAAAAR